MDHHLWLPAEMNLSCFKSFEWLQAFLGPLEQRRKGPFIVAAKHPLYPLFAYAHCDHSIFSHNQHRSSVKRQSNLSASLSHHLTSSKLSVLCICGNVGGALSVQPPLAVKRGTCRGHIFVCIPMP